MNIKPDSPIIYHGTRIVNLLILNFFWILGCLPVITAGASTIAAFTITLKMVEESESSAIVVPFWSAFVHNLRHGIPLTLILLVGIWAAWLDWQLFENLEGTTIGFLIVGMLLLFLLVMHFLYVFPLEARYENTILGSLSNARRIFMRFFPRTLGLAGILVVQYLLFTRVHIVLLYLGILCMPVLMIYTISQVVMPIFRKIEQDSHAGDHFQVGGGEDHSVHY